MRSLHITAVLSAAALITCSGCAGFRGGWKSVAYIGDTAPVYSADTDIAMSSAARSTIRIPGLQLNIALDNQLRSYDTQVYLYVLPLSIDPRDVYSNNNEPGKTRLFLTVKPSDTSFEFHPTEAVLLFGEKRIVATAGFEFARWDSQGNRVRNAGRWEHRPIAPSLIFDEAGRSYNLSIDFKVPVPSPESREIAVDLSRALVSTQHPAVPLIRFAPVRWKEGYT